jgi:hypothetical protein
MASAKKTARRKGRLVSRIRNRDNDKRRKAKR